MTTGQYSFLTLVPKEEIPVAPPTTLVEKVHVSFDTWCRNVVRAGEYAWLQEFTIDSQRIIYLDRCWAEELKWKEWCNAVEETNKTGE
jgi:hypothetical protein